jgi:hypothetical protein
VDKKKTQLKRAEERAKKTNASLLADVEETRRAMGEPSCK